MQSTIAASRLAAALPASRRATPSALAALQPVLPARRPCSSAACFRRAPAAAPQQQQQKQQRRGVVAVRAEGGGSGEFKKNTEFGYSRKDVILIGSGMIGAGYALYYGLQAKGMDAGMAGNFAQLIIFVGLCFGWVGSYLFRVATKQMTYAKQLEEYEEAVMRKRLEEMPEQEVERVLAEVDTDKERREAARKQRQQQQQQEGQ